MQYFSSSSKQGSLAEDYPFSSWPDVPSGENAKGQKDAAVLVSLYDHCSTDNLDKGENLLDKIADEVARINLDDLDRIIIPFLSQMINSTKQQLSGSPQFYTKAISTYIERVVQMEPSKPSTWSLSDDMRTCYGSNCTYCTPVREFLDNPSREGQTFAVSKKQCHDFNWHFPCSYKKTVNEDGDKYTIHVTKTYETWEQNHKRWQARFNRAQSTLRSLPEAPLRQHLSNHNYEVLMELQLVRIPSESAVKDPSTAQAETVPNVPAKRGRKRRKF